MIATALLSCVYPLPDSSPLCRLCEWPAIPERLVGSFVASRVCSSQVASPSLDGERSLSHISSRRSNEKREPPWPPPCPSACRIPSGDPGAARIESGHWPIRRKRDEAAECRHPQAPPSPDRPAAFNGRRRVCGVLRRYVGCVRGALGSESCVMCTGWPGEVRLLWTR